MQRCAIAEKRIGMRHWEMDLSRPHLVFCQMIVIRPFHNLSCFSLVTDSGVKIESNVAATII